MGTFLCHIDDVGDGKCGKSGRQQGAKRATVRAAMTMATMVAGNKEGGGDGGKSNGNGDEDGGRATATREKATSMRAMATVTGVACDKEARVRVMPKAMRVVGDEEGEGSKATATATRVASERW